MGLPVRQSIFTLCPSLGAVLVAAPSDMSLSKINEELTFAHQARRRNDGDVRTLTFSRRIVGWRQSSSMHTEFVLDALEQALYDRKPSDDGSLTHHSDRGSQYLSIRYSERLAEAGIEPSVGSRGDSYDNALAETINGLYKAEVIHRRGPWKTKQAVELATLEWVAWFNHHRLMEPLGYIPPAEFEANYHRQRAGQAATV